MWLFKLFVGCLGDFLFYVSDKNNNWVNVCKYVALSPGIIYKLVVKVNKFTSKELFFPRDTKNVSKPLISLSLFVLRELIFSSHSTELYLNVELQLLTIFIASSKYSSSDIEQKKYLFPLICRYEMQFSVSAKYIFKFPLEYFWRGGSASVSIMLYFSYRFFLDIQRGKIKSMYTWASMSRASCAAL